MLKGLFSIVSFELFLESGCLEALVHDLLPQKHLFSIPQWIDNLANTGLANLRAVSIIGVFSCLFLGGWELMWRALS